MSPPPENVEPATGLAGATDPQDFLHRATVELHDSIELEPTLRRVARLAVPALGDTCAVHLLEGHGRFLVQVAEAAVSPALEAEIRGLRRHPVERDSMLGRALGARAPLLIDPFDESYFARAAEPLRGAVRALQLQRAVVVRLVYRGEPLGTLSVGTHAPGRSWSAADLRVLEEIGRRAGTAVAHARLLDRTRRTAERLSALERIAVELGQALTRREVAHVVLSHAAPAVHAQVAGVYALEPGERLSLLEELGYTEPQRARFSELPLDGVPLPATAAVLRDQDLWIGSRAEYLDRYPAMTADLLQPVEDLAVACLVLRARGRPSGLLVLSFRTARQFDAEERAFLRALADHCAQALERARLYDEAQAAMRIGERAAAEQRFLAEASAALAASPDVAGALREVARLAVGELADAIAFDVPELNPQQPLALSASSPELAARVEALRRRFPLQQRDELARTLHTGQAKLRHLDDAAAESPASDVEHLAALRALGLRSSAAVPLRARGGVVGMLSAASATRRYGEGELALLQQLADRVGLAVDAARLVRAERRARADAEQATHLLHALVAASPLSVMVLDLDGTVQVWNPAAERMYGWKAHEVLGSYLRAVPEDRREEFAQHLREVARGEVVLGHETVRHRSDGTSFDAALWTARLEGPDGQVRCMSIVADITERKRAERGLRLLARAGELLGASSELEARLEAVARLAVPDFADWCLLDRLQPDGALQRIAIHAEHKHAALAWALRRRAHQPAGEVGLGGVLGSGEPLLAGAVDEALLESLAADPEQRRQLQACGVRALLCVPLRVGGRVEGALSWLSCGAGRGYGEPELQLAADVAGRISAALERSRLFEQAQSARLRAEDANRTKDEFLATLSHELRTPLTSILGYAHMLRRGAIPEERRARAHEVIERNAKAQAQLVGDMLDLARIATGKLRLSVQPVDPAKVVEAALDVVRLAAEEKAIAIEFERAESPSPILADPDRLQQVLWNLLTNAIKFSPRGGKVRLRLQQSALQTTFAVADRGEGIPAAFMPRLFERFSQADGSSTRVHGGLGLGLSLVRHLVELHGGTVSAQSEGEGRGATFTVQLPGGSAAQEREAPVPFAVAPRLRGLRVLLVDDDAETREMVAQVLTLAGASVDAAESAAQAMVRLASARPDLIVSDLGMPEEDGLSFLRRVRALPAHSGGGVPALALSAYARPEDRERALQAGYQRHLAKPVEPEALLRELDELLPPAGAI